MMMITKIVCLCVICCRDASLCWLDLWWVNYQCILFSGYVLLLVQQLRRPRCIFIDCHEREPTEINQLPTPPRKRTLFFFFFGIRERKITSKILSVSLSVSLSHTTTCHHTKWVFLLNTKPERSITFTFGFWEQKWDSFCILLATPCLQNRAPSSRMQFHFHTLRYS